jgi:hypothetical protein
MARDIHTEMMSCEEGLHEDDLEGDMEADLAHDLEDVHHGHEAGHLEADAEEDLASDMLGDEDMAMDGDEAPAEEHSEEGLEDELHSHEEHDKDTEEKVDELEDHMMDVDEELAKLQAMFDEMNGEHEHVEEGVEMSKVTVKMGGEQGGAHFAGTEQQENSPFKSVNSSNNIKLGGEPLEIGLGKDHTDFKRQEPTVKAKDLPKTVNVVSSTKAALKPEGKHSGKYLTNPKGEVGSGKSGMPVEGNVDSTIGSKK